MRTKERAYRSEVCRWQGSAEPTDAGDATSCPQCGVFLYPLAWWQTWGIALVAIGGTIGVVLGAAYLLK
jgi:hypothetical protein